MVEHPGGARLLLEALQRFAVADRDVRQDLDGHVAAEARVARAVDHTHAALAEEADDAVWAEHRIGLESHRWRRGV